MQFSTLIYSLAVMSSAGLAQYVLEDDYFSNGNFFGEFSFWDSSDPTHGFVSYQGFSAAQQQNLVSQTSNSAYMGVDYTNVAPNGRNSVRLTSNKSYNSGLVIVDIAHMPGGICGTWPAFWMVGPNWPYDGEIDIIEGVNEQNQNDMTLHTGPTCAIADAADFLGSLTSTTCNSADGNNNGCQIQAQDSNTYGAGFNQNNGGVYATEITDSAISIWFFPRNAIPSDIESGSPNPSGWGTPLSVFSGACDIPSNFQELQIVFDTTFCGDWAGNVWSSSTCSSQASTCNSFVQNNPSAFKDAYWSVNALKVYQNNGGSGSVSSAPAPAPTTSIPLPIVQPTTMAISVAPLPTGNGPLGSNNFNPAPSSSAAPAPTSSPVAVGSGPLGSNNFNPAPSSSAAPSPAPAPAPTSAPVVVGSGPLGSNNFNPAPTSASAPANSGSGPLSSSSFDPSPVANDGGQNAVAPASITGGSTNSWAPVIGSNGIISEELEPSRRLRRARHVRAHKLRHSRF